MNNNTISVVFADSSHAHYAPRICDLIYESALQRGTGIAKRSPEYIAAKMTDGKAVVALDGEKLVGFSYIECWGHGDFVATSGLIVPRTRSLICDTALISPPRPTSPNIATSSPIGISRSPE